jgi:hypothetical protein
MLEKALIQPEQSKDLAAYTDQYTLSMAIDRFRRELQKDKQPGSRCHAWESNMAMVFYDLLAAGSAIGQQAAINFLETLCLQTNNNTGSIKPGESQKLPPTPPNP